MPTVPCSNCQVPTDPHRRDVLREVIGWERVRAAGGANAIIEREPTGKVLCVACGTMKRLGATLVDPNQGELW